MTLNKMDQYLYQNLKRLADNGYKDEYPRAKYEDGTPAHSISITGGVYEIFDLSKGEVPITETRPIPWKTAIKEIQVIYQDQSSLISDFEKRGVNYWNKWDIGDGSIGMRYGATVDKYNLMNKLLDDLIHNPFSKRHLIELYQYADLQETDGLHPCAHLTQWSVRKHNQELYLDLTLVQRSSDLLIAGTSINQIQYVALQMMVAKHCGYKVGLFEHYRKNVHVYDRHEEQVIETINRLDYLDEMRKESKIQFKLNVPDGTCFYDINIDDFELTGYNPIKPQLKFELAI